MAAWDDMVELYCFEKYGQGQPHRMVLHRADTSTGECVGTCLWKRIHPAWYDDAALYELDYASGKRIIRRRTTPERSKLYQPAEQAINVYSAGDK